MLRVPSIDLTVRPEAEAFAECDRIARVEATKPFDLSIAPLIRVTHVRVRSDVAVVLVTAHHAVCDGWSIGLLAREMGILRRPCRRAVARICRISRLLTATTPPGRGRWLQATVLRRRSRIGPAPWTAWSSSSCRPISRAVPLLGSSGAIQSQLLDRDLTDRLAAIARQNGCTLFMLAYAALVTLLHRYTGATDIAVGTQVVGRDQVETESLVGLFINTLVLRADSDG